VQFFDVTRPLSGDAVVYSGDTKPEFRQEDRGPYLITDLHMSSHSGTHIDAPVHYLKWGATIDEVELPTLIGPCRVADLSGVSGEIRPAHIENCLGSASRLLLKTPFSSMTCFDSDFSHLGIDAARLLVKHGIRCVGIDSPSIEGFRGDGSVHRELLGADCIIIELLDLSLVSPGDYTLIALPLRLRGIDGAPARVVLGRENGG
jgi:arylformamidase